MTYETREISGSVIKLELHHCPEDIMKPWTVAIYFDGAYWDCYSYASEDMARQFYDNPMASFRPAPQQPEQLDTRYIADNMKVSTGKRIGKKAGC